MSLTKITNCVIEPGTITARGPLSLGRQGIAATATAGMI